ncbi:MAG: twin-arginine translocation signal domain-containing protein, partial [Terriglobales bacterium]
MTKENSAATAEAATQSGGDGPQSPSQSGLKRRSFLKGLGVTGAALSAGSLLATAAEASSTSSVITIGDVAILRFLAAA